MDVGVTLEAIHLDSQDPDSLEPVQFGASGSEDQPIAQSPLDESVLSTTDHIVQNTLDHIDVAQSIVSENGEDIEWVECEEEEEFFSLRIRILLAMIAITLVAAFFYMLEKRRQKAEQNGCSGHVNRPVCLDKGDVLDPLGMVGIDLVKMEEEMKLRLDNVPLTPGHTPGLTVTTPGGTHHWETEFYLHCKKKVANGFEKVEEEGQENVGDKEEILQVHLEHSATPELEQEPITHTAEPELTQEKHEMDFGDQKSQMEVESDKDHQKGHTEPDMDLEMHTDLHQQSSKPEEQDQINHDHSESQDQGKSESENLILEKSLLEKLMAENPPDQPVIEEEVKLVLVRPQELVEQIVYDLDEPEYVVKQDTKQPEIPVLESSHEESCESLDGPVEFNESTQPDGNQIFSLGGDQIDQVVQESGDQHHVNGSDNLEKMIGQTDHNGNADQTDCTIDQSDQVICSNDQGVPMKNQTDQTAPTDSRSDADHVQNQTDQINHREQIDINENLTENQAGITDNGHKEENMSTEHDIHSKSQADSVEAAAVGDDYEHVVAKVQLKKQKGIQRIKSESQEFLKSGVDQEQADVKVDSGNQLGDQVIDTATNGGHQIEQNDGIDQVCQVIDGNDQVIMEGSHVENAAINVEQINGGSAQFLEINEGGKEASGSPALEAEVVDLEASPSGSGDQEKLDKEEVHIQEDSSPQDPDQSMSRSEDPPSMCEHTTAPEIETFEVSDVEMEQDEEDGVEGEGQSPQESKKNGSPPVILTQVTATAPHRRVYTNGGLRLVKVETVELAKESQEKEQDLVNGRGQRGEDEEENGRKSSIFEVIGATSMDEALIKMETLEAVTAVMRMAGLEASNLIFGIDYTASNKYQGEISFEGESLHKISDDRFNPYQQVITIMGQTLAPFAQGGHIPAYGFGDIRTSDTSIFPLKADGFCKSFPEVLQVYNEITPKVILSGPTNFAPLIYQAIEICKEFKCYHILVIVADGQVTNERATRRAIVDACRYPLSIIVVGVGDGPWDMMRIFDEKLPKRPWDNFHFVEFYTVTAGSQKPDLAFAVQSLLEIPDQYKQIKALGLLNFV